MKEDNRNKFVAKYNSYSLNNDLEFNYEDTIEVLDIFEKENVDEKILDSCIEILGVKPSKVQNILDIIDELKIDRKILLICPQILIDSNVTRIKENINLLKREKINLSLIYNFPDIIKTGKSSDMAKVIKYIKTSEDFKNPKEYIEKNGDILAYGKAQDMKKIACELKKENLLEKVLLENPEIMYKNSPKVVKDIIELFKNDENLKWETLKSNLEILSETTKVRINAIINLFKRHSICPDIINEEPKMLYLKTTKNIDEIIKDLKDLEFTPENIYKVPIVFRPMPERQIANIFQEFKYVKENSKFLRKILFKNPNVIIELDMKKAKEFQDEVLKGHFKEEYIINKPEILLQKTPLDVKKVIVALEAEELENYPEGREEIFLIDDPINIVKISNILKLNNIDKKVLYESTDIFLKEAPQKIENNINVLKDNNIDLKNINQKNLLNPNSIVNKQKAVEKEKENKELKEKENKENKENKKEKNKAKVKVKKENKEEKAEIKATEKVEKESEKLKDIKEENIEVKAEIEEKQETYIPEDLVLKFKEIGIEKDEICSKLKISEEEFQKASNIENLINIFEYFEDIGISSALENGYNIFKIDFEKIKENMDIYIEQGFFVNIAYNLDALEISKSEIEKKISVLEDNLIIEFDDLILDKEKFVEKHNISLEDFENIKLKDYAEFNITNKYKKYLKLSPRQMYVKESKVYEEIYKKILDLGTVNNNLEYIKCGEKFSILKIEENMHKIIVGIADNENIDIFNLPEFNKNEIITLSIIGGRRLDKAKTLEIEDSILKEETEDEWVRRNTFKITHKELKEENKEENKNKKQEKNENQKEDPNEEDAEKIIDAYNLNIKINHKTEEANSKVNNISYIKTEDPKLVLENMKKVYDSGNLKLDMDKIKNENELIVPEYEKIKNLELQKQKEEQLKLIEEKIKDELKSLEEKEKEELESKNGLLNSIQNTLNLDDPDLIILENLNENKERQINMNLDSKENKYDFDIDQLEKEISKELKLANIEMPEMTNGITLNNKASLLSEQNQGLNETNTTSEISFEDFSNNISDLDNLNLKESIDLNKNENVKQNAQSKEDDHILKMLESEKEARAKLEEEISSLKKMQEEFLRSLTEAENLKKENIPNEAANLEDLKIKNEKENLNVNVNDNSEDKKEENVQKANNETEQALEKNQKEVLRIVLDSEKTIEKDMEEGALKGYDELEKNIKALSIDPEKLIIESYVKTANLNNENTSLKDEKGVIEIKEESIRNLENADKETLEDNNDLIKNEFSKMENNLQFMQDNFKMFSGEVEQRRANFEARKRKKIQEIRDRRARNKTIEEATKLEETARKLRKQAEVLELERNRLKKEKELELERIKLETEKTNKALEEERLKLEEERRKEQERLKELEAAKLKEIEEEKLKLQEALKKEEEKRQKELEVLIKEQEKQSQMLKAEMEKLEQEKREEAERLKEEQIANLIKIEAQKIIEKEGLLDVKEEYEKLKQDLAIEKMYKETKELKEAEKNNLEVSENKEEKVSYPENISDFNNLNMSIPYEENNLTNTQKANISNSDINKEMSPKPTNMFNQSSNFMDEYNKENSKDFFDLEDYSYLTQMVADEEVEKMKANMNNLFRQKKSYMEN